MFLDIWTSLVFVLVFCIVFAYRKACKPKNFPPGPPTTPFIGNCSVVIDNKYIHNTFMDLKNKYGPIFSLQLGWYPAIVISSPELLKEAFVKKAEQFSNRANHMFMMRLFKLGDKGIINTHGEIFKASKRMTMTALRDFGVGKASNEMIITEEVSAILEEIGEKKSKPFQFGALFNKVSCNVICSTLFSKRYDYNDPEYVELLTKMTELFEHNDFMYSILLPFCLPLLFLDPSAYQQIDLWNHIVGFVNKEIKEHRQTFDAQHIRDFVDIYIDAEHKNSSQTVSSSSKTDSDPAQAIVSIWSPVSQTNVSLEQNIVAIILELFAAGTETTGTTLMWAMAYMIKHPEIQLKCRDEIFQVVGKGGRVSLKDRKEMPYVEATICEVQRIGNIIPIGLMHCTNGPVEFHGYSLPADTIVIPNTYAIHMDPKEWRNPEEFDPNRFLNSEGQFVKHTSFMPFSIGQRACPGEGLAKAELFLVFTSMIQNYEFTAPDISKVPTFKDATLGTTLVLPVYDVIATPVE